MDLRQNCLAPILQLPIKSVVLADATILSGLSENNIVLSDTSLNSSVEVVAFTSDTEPDCALWINKNFAPVILLLPAVAVKRCIS